MTVLKSNWWTWVIICAGLIGVLAGYSRLVYPQRRSLYAAQQQLETLRQAQDHKAELYNRVRASQQRIEQLRQDIAKLGGAFFTPESAEKFLSNLEQTATVCGCTLLSVSLSSPPPPGNVDKKDGSQQPAALPQQAAIQLDGPYESITRFISTVTSGTHMVHSSDIHIRHNPADEPDTFNCSLKLTVHLLSQTNPLQ